MNMQTEKVGRVVSSKPLRQLLEDEKLRGHLIAAFKHSRALYSELAQTKPGKAPMRLASDEKLQKQLRAAVDELQRARHRTHKRSMKPLLLIAGGLLAAVLLSKRQQLSDLTLATDVSGKDAAADGSARRPSSVAT